MLPIWTATVTAKTAPQRDTVFTPSFALPCAESSGTGPHIVTREDMAGAETKDGELSPSERLVLVMKLAKERA